MRILTYIHFFLLLLSCTTKSNEPDTLKIQDTDTPSIENTEVLICKGSASYAYHDNYCQGLNKCKAQVVKMSIDQAKDIGRKPCGYCYNSTPLKSNVKSASYQAADQCNVITKRGTRCSRKARSGGYCWQHGS
jgi:hypothetical protein